MKRKKELKEILTYYGELAQTIKAIEELSELSVVLCKMLNNRENLQDYYTYLCDEVADCKIMINQIELMFPNLDFDGWVNYKIDRTINNINQEKIIL